jgi:multidrug resistance protein, MATE family
MGYWGRVRKEARVVLSLAVPAIATSCSQQAMVVTDQIFVGHLGTKQLAAAAIANTVRPHDSNSHHACGIQLDVLTTLHPQYFNLMWFFLLGMTSAMDTLGSQAYGAQVQVLTCTVPY